MLATVALREELRAYIGERIPSGGTDTDTRFTDEQVDLWLLEVSETLEEAAWRGWLLKAGEDTNDGMIERTVGSERLKFADPAASRKDALAMADYYASLMPKGDREGSQLAELEPPDVLRTQETGQWDMSRILGYE